MTREEFAKQMRADQAEVMRGKAEEFKQELIKKTTPKEDDDAPISR
jgi:hypothetical protein